MLCYAIACAIRCSLALSPGLLTCCPRTAIRTLTVLGLVTVEKALFALFASAIVTPLVLISTTDLLTIIGTGQGPHALITIAGANTLAVPYQIAVIGKVWTRLADAVSAVH